MAAARYRDEADAGAVSAPTRSDAYTGMLIISLAAMILGCILLLLEFLSYDGDTKPPKVMDLGQQPTRSAPAGTPGPPVAPTAPAPGR
jgi:hypothetical protein